MTPNKVRPLYQPNYFCYREISCEYNHDQHHKVKGPTRN